ncbi:MAG TPA: hypothetical protein VN238_05995 [Solirubrobacteraceae bacterium]|nr:hypothetical protein [Solirubrobacteraceae bacterium]
MFRMKKLRLALCGALAIGAVAGPAVALADYVYFFDGVMNSGDSKRSAGASPLYEVSGRSDNGQTICVVAVDAGYNQYGSVACSDNLAVHPYARDPWKYGYARPAYGAGVRGRARVDF